MAWYDDTSKKSAVREYKSRQALDADAAKAAEHGWQLIGVTESAQRSGCMRILLLWFVALLWKPKPHFIATYTRIS